MVDESRALAVIQRQLCEVLELDADAVNPQHLLIELGADSLRLTQAVARIEDELDVPLLNANELLDVRTVTDLARLAVRLANVASPSPGNTPSSDWSSPPSRR